MNTREYLSFTKRERTGIIILIVLLLIILIIPKFFYRQEHTEKSIVQSAGEKLNTAKKYKTGFYRYKSRDSSSGYGRKYKNATYKKYDKGGYSLYANKPSNHYAKVNSGYQYSRRASGPALIIDINTADTTQFIALPGIGSKLAARIVLFREKLGGFYDVRQISEVYGLQDSVFQKISRYLKCDPGLVKKIEINVADKNELKLHPYIRWNIANALVAYRSQHGSFISPEDLERISNIDSSSLHKMIPYISFK